MTATESKRPRRPTVTVDFGEDTLHLLDGLVAKLSAESPVRRKKRGLRFYQAISRSVVVRLAVEYMAKKERLAIVIKDDGTVVLANRKALQSIPNG